MHSVDGAPSSNCDDNHTIAHVPYHFGPAIRINKTFKIFNGHFGLIENGVFKMAEKGASA